MTPKKRSPLYQREQETIDAFHGYQWHLVLDPLYEQFQRWKAGEVSHLEMDEAIHKTHKACQQFAPISEESHWLARYKYKIHLPKGNILFAACRCYKRGARSLFGKAMKMQGRPE